MGCFGVGVVIETTFLYGKAIILRVCWVKVTPAPHCCFPKARMARLCNGSWELKIVMRPSVLLDARVMVKSPSSSGWIRSPELRYSSSQSRKVLKIIFSHGRWARGLC